MCTCRLAVAPQSHWHSQEKSISSCSYPKLSSQLCSTSYCAGFRPKCGFPYPVGLKIEPFQKNISTGTYQATANGVAERGHRKEALQIKELKDTCKTAKNKSKQDRLLAVMNYLSILERQKETSPSWDAWYIGHWGQTLKLTEGRRSTATPVPWETKASLYSGKHFGYIFWRLQVSSHIVWSIS